MAYLGDVGDSVTGDKRAQKFEDDFLDELVPFLCGAWAIGAITYMPSRNTPAQLKRIRALCDKYGLFQISGEDINSPRQSFVCEAQRASGIRQSVRSHLGADRSRMAFHQESRRRAVLQGERRPVARPFRPGEGLLRLRSGNVQIIHTTRRRKNRRFFQNRRGMSK